jgi:predicted HicB family RNase H-like nuclease
MTFDAHAYTITTKKITRDGETVFKASVAEVPSLATYEDSPEHAYATIIEDIEALHALAVQHGHEFPAPLAERGSEASGRVTLRLPRTLHQRLAEQCVVEDVSLNTYIISLLSETLTARSISDRVTVALQTHVRAALTATQLIHEAGVGKPTAVYSTTSEISLPAKDDTWTKLH